MSSWRVRFAVSVGVIAILASCGTPPRATSDVAPSPLTSLDAPSSDPAATTACQLVRRDLPPTDPHAQVVVAVTTDGELVVGSEKIAGVVDSLSILDPASGSIVSVISRPPPNNLETAVSSIADVAADRGWVVWNETGFSLAVGDWTIWAASRSTGEVRMVARFEPGRDGKALPGWINNLSVLGDLAVWAAPVQVANRIESRIYVADLVAHTTSKLAANANYPSLLAGPSISGLVEGGRDQAGLLLAQPATLSISDGSVTVASWATPMRLVRHAASDTGEIVIHVTREATASQPDSSSEVVLLQDRVTRVYPLSMEWDDVAAGTGFLAWSDQSHLWVLPTGAADPIVVVEASDPLANIRYFAAGLWLYWHTDAYGATGEKRALLRLACP